LLMLVISYFEQTGCDFFSCLLLCYDTLNSDRCKNKKRKTKIVFCLSAMELLSPCVLSCLQGPSRIARTQVWNLCLILGLQMELRANGILLLQYIYFLQVLLIY
jgi:hypothetical protein